MNKYILISSIINDKDIDNIIRKFNWQLVKSIDNYYTKGSTELVYNRNIDGGKTWI